MVSAARRSDAGAGKIWVPRAMNSFRTSFWMSRPNALGSTPRFLASAKNIAAHT